MVSRAYYIIVPRSFCYFDCIFIFVVNKKNSEWYSLGGFDKPLNSEEIQNDFEQHLKI